MAAEDKHWAKAYVLDPLTAPDPSDETGPGTHFRSTFAPASKSDVSKTDLPTPPNSGTPTSMQSKNPFRRSSDMSKDGATVRTRASSDASRKQYTPSHSTRNSRHSGQFRKEAFGSSNEDRSRSAEPSSPRIRSRGNSTNERPLEFAKHDMKLAHRSPHLRKKHLPGPDSIDRLDVGPAGRYHHEGPYDAALLARNTSWQTSPVAALSETNAEALRATPAENIRDAVERHRPLDGTAIVPPGSQDRFGRTYDYEEGDNLMITNGGNYKRWPGVDYHPDDLKGKGEPSYSIEKALKEHKIHGDRERTSNGSYGEVSGIEMQGGPVDSRDSVEMAGGQQAYTDLEHQTAAETSGSTKRHSLQGLKKRIGSLRKKKE